MGFRTVATLTSVMLLAATLIGSAISSAAESNEKLTGLPLHLGLTFPQEVDSAVCGKKAKMILYDASPDASLAEYVTWYKRIRPVTIG